MKKAFIYCARETKLIEHVVECKEQERYIYLRCECGCEYFIPWASCESIKVVPQTSKECC
jgi:hypothetical protein